MIHVNNVDMTNIDFQTAQEAISQTNYLNIVSELSFSFFSRPTNYCWLCILQQQYCTCQNSHQAIPQKILMNLELLNLFQVNVPILYPLKTPENFWFSGVFSGVKMETARN